MNIKKLVETYRKFNENEAEDICNKFYWKMQDLQHKLFDQMIEACEKAKDENISFGQEIAIKFADKMNEYTNIVNDFQKYLNHLENYLNKENKDEDEVKWTTQELEHRLECVENIIKR